MLKYRIMEGKNLKEDNMIKNSSRVDFSLPETNGLSRSLRSVLNLLQASQTRAFSPSGLIRPRCFAIRTRLCSVRPQFRSHKGRGKRAAFTLAEVLITLGIIGVVAAMTIASLVTKFQHKAEVSALKKAYSALSQAYLQVTNEYGQMPGELCLTNDSQCLGDLFENKFKYLSRTLWVPNSGVAQGCWESNDISMGSESHYCTVTEDGIVYDFDMEFGSGVNNKDREAIVSIDINGVKKPNIWGRDRYMLIMSKSRGVIAPSRDEKINPGEPFCNKGKGGFYNNKYCAYQYLFEE